MNIFVTDESPERSAINLDDKRIIKMILESTQLLCTAVNIHGGKTPYKSTHVNHPSNVWTRTSRTNWYWLWNHTYELMDRYQAIYGKNHKCRMIIIDLVDNKLEELIPDIGPTPFANCAANADKGISYKDVTDVTLAYRLYLIDRWNTDARKPTWQKRNLPKWLAIDNMGKFVYSD